MGAFDDVRQDAADSHGHVREKPPISLPLHRFEGLGRTGVFTVLG
jgi:hypothetical protein